MSQASIYLCSSKGTQWNLEEKTRVQIQLSFRSLALLGSSYFRGCFTKTFVTSCIGTLWESWAKLDCPSWAIDWEKRLLRSHSRGGVGSCRRSLGSERQASKISFLPGLSKLWRNHSRCLKSSGGWRHSWCWYCLPATLLEQLRIQSHSWTVEYLPVEWWSHCLASNSSDSSGRR